MAGRPKDNPVDPFDLMSFAASKPEIAQMEAFSLDGRDYGKGIRDRASFQALIRLGVGRYDPVTLLEHIQFRVQGVYNTGVDQGEAMLRLPNDANRLAKLKIDVLFDTIECTDAKVVPARMRLDALNELDDIVAYCVAALSNETKAFVNDSRNKRYQLGGGSAAKDSSFVQFLTQQKNKSKKTA